MGRKDLRASAFPSLPSPRENWAQRGWPAANTSKTLALGTHKHGVSGFGKHCHVGLQHIIMEARCEQLAVLEPLGLLEDQQAFLWGRDGRGRASQCTQFCPISGSPGLSRPVSPSPILVLHPTSHPNPALPSSHVASCDTSLGPMTIPFLKPLPWAAPPVISPRINSRASSSKKPFLTLTHFPDPLPYLSWAEDTPSRRRYLGPTSLGK